MNLLNASFELIAAVLGWISVYKLYQSKIVAGVYAPSIVFSALWGFCAIPYYFSHGDLWSAVSCSIRVLALVSWSCLWGWNVGVRVLVGTTRTS